MAGDDTLLTVRALMGLEEACLAKESRDWCICFFSSSVVKVFYFFQFGKTITIQRTLGSKRISEHGPSLLQWMPCHSGDDERRTVMLNLTPSLTLRSTQEYTTTSV